MTHDTMWDISDMVGRRLPIISFWIVFIILALGWIIQTWQLKDERMSITINQTVITDNPALIIKGSITGVHNQMARLQDLSTRKQIIRNFSLVDVHSHGNALFNLRQQGELHWAAVCKSVGDPFGVF